MKNRERPLSWEKIHRDTVTLAQRIRARGRYEGIVAVSRGGLTPAAILSHQLDLRHVETVCIASYHDDRDRTDIELLKKSAFVETGANWLVVDDLMDTGKTAHFVRRMLPEACIVALYVKPAGRDQADLFIEEVPQDTWIVFPWEVEPD